MIGHIISYMSAFAQKSMIAGDPVSIIGTEGFIPIVEPYDGKNYNGISYHTVIDIDILSCFSMVEKPIGSLIHVITKGTITLNKVPYAEIGGFLQPSKRYKWKATKKQKRKSIGRIVRIDDNWMEIILL